MNNIAGRCNRIARTTHGGPCAARSAQLPTIGSLVDGATAPPSAAIVGMSARMRFFIGSPDCDPAICGCSNVGAFCFPYVSQVTHSASNLPEVYGGVLPAAQTKCPHDPPSRPAGLDPPTIPAPKRSPATTLDHASALSCHLRHTNGTLRPLPRTSLGNPQPTDAQAPVWHWRGVE